MSALRTSLTLLALSLLAPGASLPDLRRSFENPPEDARLMVRWWWFGPAVTHSELEREMRAMKAAGIGGFEVQPVYPMQLEGNLPYLSPEFLDAVRFTAETARKLGLRMDMTLGSGWPYGGPHIKPEEGAMRLRIEQVRVGPERARVSVPQVGPAERILAAFAGSVQLRAVDGKVDVPAADRPRDVQFFFAGRTGMQVKRASVGAEGPVLDHMNRAAMEKHLRVVGDKLVAAAGPGGIRAVFCDSLEVFSADWAEDLLEQFRKRRGYDLTPLLPSLVGEPTPETADVRHDWGQTVTELFNERFLTPLRDWSHRNKLLSRVQAYGTPAASLSSYGLVDLPEGEGTGWDNLSSTRWAASAAHHYGQPQVSSETWTFVHAPRFRATPLDLKAGADNHFLAGVNQLIAHGWPYSPEDAAMAGGWAFYATIALNDRNPWWPVMPDLSAYIQRMSFLLRQGEPVNDVALYAPAHDGWARFFPGRASLISHTREQMGSAVVPALLEAGYNFDLVDDAMLAGRPLRHRILVLPNVERIPLTTLRKLAAFARGGGILIATRRVPDKAPGLREQRTETPQVAALAKELFASNGHFVRDEKQELGRLLRGLSPPDVTFSPTTREIGFLHRRAAGADIYFIANTTETRRRVTATFRAATPRAEWWDPFTGKTRAAGTVREIELEPYESRVLVFSEEAAAKTQAATVALPAPIDISQGWDVEFEGGRKVRMEKLVSWTELEGMRFYSGRATYSKTVSVTPDFLREGLAAKLDFGPPLVVPRAKIRGSRAWVEGPVREAAEVFVNGRRAGSVWHTPYEVEITGLLKPGANQIRVVVANTQVNRILGSPEPDFKALYARYGVRFRLQSLRDLEPPPSGMLGAPRIVVVQSR